jgi:hypothetical protein
LVNVAELYLMSGEAESAVERYREAVGLGQEIGKMDWAATAMVQLGDALVARDELLSATARYQEVLGIAQEMGAAPLVAHAQRGLAAVALEEGRSADAVDLATRAAEAAAGAPKEEAMARVVLARALLAEGDIGGAAEAADAAARLARESQHREAWALAEAVTARVSARSIDPADVRAALERLEGVAGEVAGAGLVTAALELRLTLGELELDARRRTRGRARLGEVAAEARERGLALIARRAEEALP